MRAADLVLLPRPRHLDVGGDGPEVAGLTVREARDPTLAPEGFRLTASRPRAFGWRTATTRGCAMGDSC